MISKAPLLYSNAYPNWIEVHGVVQALGLVNFAV